MVSYSTSTIDLGLRDLGFSLLSLISIALTILAQFLWMVLFDSTGLDVYAPDLLFMHVLPALTLALLPAVAAQYLYVTVEIEGGGSKTYEYYNQCWTLNADIQTDGSISFHGAPVY